MLDTIFCTLRRAGLPALAALIGLSLCAAGAAAPSRIKDIADSEGVRDNVLVGYGIVVGLNGTGDSLRNSACTAQSLTSMPERLGVARCMAAPGERIEGKSGAPKPDALKETALEFEAVFLAQMLKSVTSDLGGTEGRPGGGEGDPFRAMLTDGIGKLISHAGGVGMADAILKEMIKIQEVA